MGELKYLLHHISHKQSKNSYSSSEGCNICGTSLHEKENLKVEIHHTVEQLEIGKMRLKQSELGAQRKYEEIKRIQSKVVCF